jgi:transcriptional regulator with GAF, ATPase, and Fis domain
MLRDIRTEVETSAGWRSPRRAQSRILGRGPAIRRALALARQVAPTDCTVLLLGESGSGKELFASAIHEWSRRRGRAMVRVCCPAIPAPLVESEFFGREKGAYTGATSKQIGRFELAHGSTIFLDEIGDVPIDTQGKLRQVLETRAIDRLGNPRAVAVDVRVIAATNRSLEAAVRGGRFRKDLYYCLNAFPIRIPSLRERPEDIPLLVDAFVAELAAAMGKRVEAVDRASMDALLDYPWPGNVRELRNVIERAVISADGPILRVEPPQVDAAEAVA